MRNAYFSHVTHLTDTNTHRVKSLFGCKYAWNQRVLISTEKNPSKCLTLTGRKHIFSDDTLVGRGDVLDHSQMLHSNHCNAKKALFFGWFLAGWKLEEEMFWITLCVVSRVNIPYISIRWLDDHTSLTTL